MRCIIQIEGEECGRDTLDLPEAPLVGDEVGKLNGAKGYTIEVLKRRWLHCSDPYIVLVGKIVSDMTGDSTND